MLVTYALGSCIGICLHDPAIKLGALVQLHKHPGSDLLRAANPLNRLVVTHDTHLGQGNAHLPTQHLGQCCGSVAGADAANLPLKMVQTSDEIETTINGLRN